MSTRADFDFMERIGRGASSVVYKAKRKADGQIYCIKEIDLSVVTSEEEEGALREVQVPDLQRCVDPSFETIVFVACL